jgi:hypothetical protein
MALRSIERKRKSASLLATPRIVPRKPISVTHSPKKINERLSHHYRLKSEQFASNSFKGGELCQIAGNRDRYPVDLARNFTQAVKSLA